MTLRGLLRQRQSTTKFYLASQTLPTKKRSRAEITGRLAPNDPIGTSEVRTRRTRSGGPAHVTHSTKRFWLNSAGERGAYGIQTPLDKPPESQSDAPRKSPANEQCCKRGASGRGLTRPGTAPAGGPRGGHGARASPPTSTGLRARALPPAARTRTAPRTPSEPETRLPAARAAARYDAVERFGNTPRVGYTCRGSNVGREDWWTRS
jgi:hypothetical protein